jgi:hypothetical protein
MANSCSRDCCHAPLTEAAPGGGRRRSSPRWRRVRCGSARTLGRSLSIREVDAGSCNGCELEIHALNNAFYDLERFGLRFRRLAAPRRRADGDGPVTKNMREALEAHLQRNAGTEMGGRRRRFARSTAASFAASYAVTGRRR